MADQFSSAYANPGQVNAYGPNWVGTVNSDPGDIPKSGQTILGDVPNSSQPAPPPSSGGGAERDSGNAGREGGGGMGVDISGGIGATQ